MSVRTFNSLRQAARLLFILFVGILSLTSCTACMAQFNGPGQYFPVPVGKPDRKIRLRHIRLQGEQDGLIVGGTRLGLLTRGPERTADASPKVNLIAQVHGQ